MCFFFYSGKTPRSGAFNHSLPNTTNMSIAMHPACLRETGATTASRHDGIWLYLACRLKYGAGKHNWTSLVTSFLHEYIMAAFLKGALML